MSLNLYLSNRLDILADNCHEVLDRVWKEPLNPPALLLPNSALEKWLMLALCKKSGIFMGIKAVFIEQFLWKYLVATSEKPCKLIDGALLEQAILHTISTYEVDTVNPDIAPLRAYLEGSSGHTGIARTIALASRCAHLFLEYEYSRPDVFDINGKRQLEGLLTQWPHENYFSNKHPNMHNMETWQRILYRDAMSSITRDLGEHYHTLPGALQSTRLMPDAMAIQALSSGIPSQIILFGFSGMSLFHRQVLMSIGRVVDIHLFILNPCSAFWEDVATTRRNFKTRVNRQPYQSTPQEIAITTQETDNRLLELWGHAGKENIALWCQSVEYQFHEQYGNLSKGTLLSRIQTTILERSNSVPEKCLPEHGPNASLAILNCPGILREVEVLRDNILAALQQDPLLRLDQIGVYLTDLSIYRSALYEVFDAYHPDSPLYIPWYYRDTGGHTSVFSAALVHLLALTSGTYGKNSVFEFLKNPLVMASCKIDKRTIDQWIQWATTLGVSHGANQEHRRNHGEHHPSSQHTWERAFERLLLAPFCDIDIRLLNTNNPEDVIRPYAAADSDELSVAHFVRTVRALFADIDALRKSSSFSMASQRLISFVSDWTAFPDLYKSEEAIRDQIFSAINALSLRDAFTREKQTPQPELFDEFKKHLERLCDTATSGRSSYGGALCITEIGPSCTLPYSVVFIAGMNEGIFPGVASVDTLDLRTSNPIPGDQHFFRQKQFAFLEILVSTRDRLVLSFNGLDLAKDSPFSPCSTIYELLSFVNSSVLKQGQSMSPFEIPFASKQCTPKPITIENDVSSTPASTSTTLYGLKLFLLNPLEYTLRKELRLVNTEEHSDENDAEPFVSDNLTNSQIQRHFISRVTQILFESVEEKRHESMPETQQFHTWKDLFTQAHAQAIIDGLAPEGIYSEYNMVSLQDHMVAMAEALSCYALEKRNSGNWAYTSQEKLISPLKISGTLPHIFTETTGSNACEILCVSFLSGALKRGTLAKRKVILEPFLYALASIAAGSLRNYSIVFFGFADKMASRTGSVQIPVNFTQNEAQTYLSALLTAMHDTTQCFDHLPFEIAEAAFTKHGFNITSEFFADLVAEDTLDSRPLYRMYLESLKIVPKKVPEDAIEKLIERIGFLFTQSQHHPSDEAQDD